MCPCVVSFLPLLPLPPLTLSADVAPATKLNVLQLIYRSALHSTPMTGTSSLLWHVLSSQRSLLLRLMRPPVRSHGISRQSFLVYLPDLRPWVTVAFWTSLPAASLSAMYALYQVSVRQATISLSLLLAYTSRCKPWESLWGSSATTPLVDFHHRLTACPSYKQTDTRFHARPSLSVHGRQYKLSDLFTHVGNTWMYFHVRLMD